MGKNMESRLETAPLLPAFPQERYCPAGERLARAHLAYLLMALVAGIGAYIRLRGLGQWPLATDEYYMAKSIRQILKHGLPQFETGGYYLRGLLYQYLTVPFMKIFSDETAVRLIPLLAGLLTVWPLYAISRYFSRYLFPFLVVAIFSFSLWEIEFARFARMYTPFQVLFVAYLYLLVRVLLEEERRLKPWLYFFSFLSIWIYEGAIFLVGLNFFPLLFNRRVYTWRDAVLSTGLLVFTILYTFLDFRHLGEPFPFPASLIREGASSGGMLHLPVLLIRHFPENFFWGAGLAAACGFILWALWRIATGGSTPMGKVYLCAPAALAFLNLFGLAAAILALGALLQSRLAIRTDRISRRMAGLAMVAGFAFWAGVILAGGAGRLGIPPVIENGNDFVRVFFNFPDFWGNIVHPALKAVPVLAAGALALITLRLGTLIFWNFRRTGLHEILYGVFILLLLGVSLLKLPFPTTRYIFFLYPLIILLVVDACYSLSSLILSEHRLAAALTVVAAGLFFAASEDFDVDHLAHLNSFHYNYRIPYNDQRAQHYYSRWDFRTPAERINAHLKPGDLVVSFVLPVDYYLKHLDYIYADHNRKFFWSVSAMGGTVERWSNARLLYTEEMLNQILDPSFRKQTLWLVFPSEKYRWRSPLGDKLANLLGKQLFYTTDDGRICVYRLEPA